ncbi:MAG: Ldh family oxidoreductase, partial [Croceibacterium sp.]
KIRLAQARGEPIPEGWATDASGSPTTSASEAISGMLQPAAGPKGFGLAVAIELLTGALSGGGVGSAVKPLYGELDKPYNCSHTFIAIDASRTAGGAGIAANVSALSSGIRKSRRAPGVDTVYAPGDLERARRRSSGGCCTLSQEVASQLNELGRAAGMADDLLLN